MYKKQCLISLQVPDRGGRVWEQEPPPPEMPSFQKRVDQPQGQRPQSMSICLFMTFKKLEVSKFFLTLAHHG